MEDQAPEVWVVVQDDASRQQVETCLRAHGEALAQRARYQRAGSRPASSGLVESDLRRLGCDTPETGRDQAIEILESIGDGAIRLLCVTSGPAPAPLRRLCEKRQVWLAAVGQSDFEQRVAEAFKSR